MDWTEIGKTVIGGGAPILGGLLGGPAGAKVGAIVAGLLGCADSPEAVSTALASNPEALLQLKKYEMDHALELRKLELQTVQTYLSDVADARLREREITKNTGKPDVNLYLLAWTVIAGYFILVAFMITTNLPNANIGPVNQLLGGLAIGFGVVLNYFFGSTQASAMKTGLIAQLTGKGGVDK